MQTIENIENILAIDIDEVKRKNTMGLLIRVIVSLIGVLFAFCGLTESAIAWDATVTRIENAGKVERIATISRLVKGKRVEVQIEEGERLLQGSSIITPVGVRLTLKTSNGNVITVGESSCLKVTSGGGSGEEFGVDCGKSHFNVVNRLGFFNVSHKDYYAQVEGTSYEVSVKPEQEIAFSVEEGKVRIARPVKIFIQEGQTVGKTEASEILSAGESKSYRLNADEYLARFKNFGDAEVFYRKQLEDARATGDISRIAPAVNDMGYILLTISKSREAVPYFEEYQKLSEQRFPGVFGAFWGVVSLGNLAAAYTQVGGEENLKKAIEIDEKGLDLLRKIFPDGLHSLIATKLNNLGAAYRELGGGYNQQKALRYLNEAVEINKRLSDGKPSRGTAVALEQIAMILQVEGKANSVNEAIKILQEVLQIRRVLYPDGDHPELGMSFVNLGAIYTLSRSDEERRKGVALVSEGLKVLERVFPNQPKIETATALTFLCSGYGKLEGGDDYKRASGYCDQSIVMWRKLGRELELSSALKLKSDILILLDNPKAAIPLLEEALLIQQRLKPNAQNDLRGVIYRYLGFAYGGSSNYSDIQQAIGYFEKALAIARSTNDQNSVSLIQDVLVKLRRRLGA